MCKKQLIEMSRYPVAFISSFAMIFIILMMFVLGALLFLPQGEGEGGATVRSETVSITGTMTYGFILFMFLSDTLFFIGRTIRSEQLQGTLESFYLTPANKFSNLISRIFVSIVWTGLNSIAAVIIINYLVGQVPMENVLLGIYILVLSLSGYFGVGFVFAAVTINLKESTDLMANFTQLFLMIFCAMFFPFRALPDIAVNYVSKLIPISYSVDAFRSVLSGVTPELLPLNTEIVIVTLFGVLMPPIGYALFKMAEKRARKKSGLAEY
jgi:ABC-2 type transport system permease protein